MANGYFEQNRGVVTGSAFFNSFMKSYNQSMAMQADIERYRAQQLRYQESRDYASQRMGLSVLSSQRYARDEERKARLALAKAKDADLENIHLFGEGQKESETTRQARENLEILLQSGRPSITGIGRGDEVETPSTKITGIGRSERQILPQPGAGRPEEPISLKDSADSIGETFMASDEYATSATKPKQGFFARIGSAIMPKKKMPYKKFMGYIKKRNALIEDIDSWDKPAPKIKGIGKTTARDLFNMADEVDLDNFAEIRKAIPNIQDILLEDPEDTKRLFIYLKKGQLPDGRPFGIKEAIALLRQLQED